MRFLRSAGRLHLEFRTFRGPRGALRSRSQIPVPSQIFIHRRNLGDFRPKGAGNHYIFLGGRDLEKGPWVSYLPFGRRFRCGCRYRCGGPYSFPGLSALCRGCAQADRGGEGQQYGLGAMTTAKPRPPLAPGETRAYPVLPLRDIVVFPHMIAPLFVGRKKSILALEAVMRSDTFILLATQKNASDDGPATEAIYEIGTLASVLQLLKLPDGTVKVLVEGAQRAKVVKYTDCSEYYEVEAVALGNTMGERVEAEALARLATTEFESYVKLNKKVPPEVIVVVQQIEDYAKLADTIASHLPLKIPDRQAILETTAVTERLEKVLGLMESEISVLQVEKRIRNRVKRQMEKTQREYFLSEQMKAIQKEKEIGDEEGCDEFAEIEGKIKKTKLSKEAREKATHELKKLRQISPMSPEGTVVRNYLDWLLSIPWNKKSKINKDLVHAQQILDHDHYGVEKVKERIVEYLAVQQRANN